jgi:hypothetical protein
MFFVQGPAMYTSSSSFGAAGGKTYYGGDLESGPEALYPGITTSEQGLRWGFIQKARWRAEVQP